MEFLWCWNRQNLQEIWARGCTHTKCVSIRFNLFLFLSFLWKYLQTQMLSAAGDDILWSWFVREQMEQTKKQFACWHLKRNKNQIHMLKTPQTKNTYLIFKQKFWPTFTSSWNKGDWVVCLVKFSDGKNYIL